MQQSILEKIQLRKEQAEARLQEVSAKISEAFEPRRQGIEQRLRGLVEDSGKSLKNRIYALHEIMSEVRQDSAPYSPCQSGCSNCCYQRVMLTQTEADAIGAAIGLRAKVLSNTFKVKDTMQYGRNTPCTFLKGGECSIYERRPLMCRNMQNLDVDSLLCSFENWDLHRNGQGGVGIPMLNPNTPVYQTMDFLSRRGTDVKGDIRDFFPPQTP